MFCLAPRLSVRCSWLDANVRECQVFVERAVFTPDTTKIESLASDFVTTLVDPATAAEELLLRGLLLELAAKWGELLHKYTHRTSEFECGFLPPATLDAFWRGTTQPKQRFAEWARIFSSELARTHRLLITRAAARVICCEYGGQLRTEDVARAIGSSPTPLRRAFHRDTGMTVAEYVRRVRIIHALHRLLHQEAKIEAIALETGFRSKKSFYRTFESLIGMTPVMFRRLPAEAADRVLQGIKASTNWASGERSVDSSDLFAN